MFNTITLQNIGSALALVILGVSSSVHGSTMHSYLSDPDLRPVVVAFHRKDSDVSLRTLHDLLQAKPEKLNAYRVGMIVASGFDRYDELFQYASTVLDTHPEDSQALSLTLLYSRALGKTSLFDSTLATLQKSSPEVAGRMLMIIEDVERQWSSETKIPEPLQSVSDVGILALGSPANNDGSPQPRLRNTLTRTLELARVYPLAPVIVTGGAVYSRFTEAVAMKSWLIENGVESARIVVEDQARDTLGNAKNLIPIVQRLGVSKLLLVTVGYHLPRSQLTFDGVFSRSGQQTRFTGVAADNDLKGGRLRDRLKLEQIASYRDRSRALGLYVHQDFLDI